MQALYFLQGCQPSQLQLLLVRLAHGKEPHNEAYYKNCRARNQENLPHPIDSTPKGTSIQTTKNHTMTSAEANILRMDGMASEIRPRWMEYMSHTMLFKRIIAYVVSDTLSADPLVMIMKI